ncbi:RNA polymerase sigma factor [Rivibacter subsaxonicus]|uniref:RNA polymerase sigma factor n=1 Tax=Rivibacter subsaxonicus TaxID=457575 RepID=A0A4Q7W043_9BURK|nr:sigma-70 family RNA polymerase sigma factor [Rivibacter subsaxonicus]RZU02440.1 RNA polymerase sigma-70 factor (ECF subfamily) [Rivibacter subsaxonicus]
MTPVVAEPEDEAALVEHARRGDAAAFATLVRRHQSRVRQQLRRLTHCDAALADDLAQEVFMQAWHGLAAFRAEARLSTWLHRIAYTRYLMHRRGSGAAPASLDGAAEGGGLEPIAIDEQSAGVPLRLDVERAIARLPEHERLAIVHCFQLDLSHEEAAQVLGIPLGTLKTQVARAKARLREWLAAWQPEEARR